MHNQHCNNQLHYCVDSLEAENLNGIITQEFDFFKSLQDFNKALPLVMASAPADLEVCGLDNTFGDQLPSFRFDEENKLETLKLSRKNKIEEIARNSVCKIKINLD